MIFITLPSLLLILCMPRANHSYGTSSFPSPPLHPPTHPENRSKGQGHHFGHRIFKKLSWIFSHWPSSLIHCFILFYSVIFFSDGGKRERKEEGRLCRDIFSDMHKFPDQHVTSPDSDTTEPFIKIMRITEMIANARSSDRSTISPCQYQGKFITKEYGEYGYWCLGVKGEWSSFTSPPFLFGLT